mgnify:CR=1 FL=1
MEKITLKIINKSKEGVTLKGGNGIKPRTFTWDEFNSAYYVDKDDKYLAIMKPELVADFQEKKEKAEEIISDFILSMFVIEGNFNAQEKLVHLANLSDRIDQLAKVIGCSYMEATHLLQQRFQHAKKILQEPEPMMFGTKKETPKEYKARKEREKQDRPSEPTKYSLGDMDELKKLKESY